MKWSELQPPWQVCFEEAWAGFCSGSLPIGSAIFDQEGHLLARGRNHIYDDHVPPGQVSLNQLAHAELNTLLQVDRRNFDLHTCTIYTSMEPCPLCMGAIYMSGVRTVHFGARDAFAGSTNLLRTTPYLSRKNIQAHGPASFELEKIFLSILVTAELQRARTMGWELLETVLGAWRRACLEGVILGYELDHGKVLHNWVQEGRPPEFAFESLSKMLERE